MPEDRVRILPDLAEDPAIAGKVFDPQTQEFSETNEERANKQELPDWDVRENQQDQNDADRKKEGPSKREPDRRERSQYPFEASNRGFGIPSVFKDMWSRSRWSTQATEIDETPIPVYSWKRKLGGPIVPGGKGHGTGIYFCPKKLKFATSTSISINIIFPDSPASGFNNYVYLTSSNRSKFGAEAYIRFFAEEAPSLCYKDFAYEAANDPRYPYRGTLKDSASLRDYFQTVTIGGKSYRSIRIINETIRSTDLTKNYWFNRIYLARDGHPLDPVRVVGYDLGSQSQDADDYAGFWGPTVETRVPVTAPLNPMGFGRTMLALDGVTQSFIWTGDVETSNIALYIREAGISPPLTFPDYSFIVT